MTENLLNALAITAIGMGLVFGVLLLLWAVIGGLVYLLADREREAPAPVAEPAPPQEVGDSVAHRRKEQAAVAAVAVALALIREAEAVHPAMRGAPITPWQNIMRGRQALERGRRR
jgi:Na+-transporting methylmalonyl-CoA/oxaloacetate decarboxylase gamma subunit